MTLICSNATPSHMNLLRNKQPPVMMCHVQSQGLQCASSHWIIITTLRDKFSWPHFMGEETETQSRMDWAKVI